MANSAQIKNKMGCSIFAAELRICVEYLYGNFSFAYSCNVDAY